MRDFPRPLIELSNPKCVNSSFVIGIVCENSLISASYGYIYMEISCNVASGCHFEEKEVCSFNRGIVSGVNYILRNILSVKMAPPPQILKELSFLSAKFNL